MDSAEQRDTDNVEEADQQMAMNELEGAEESDASSPRLTAKMPKNLNSLNKHWSWRNRYRF